MISLVEFQDEAVEKLTSTLARLWNNPKKQLPIVFKSPTGSGKTLVLANFIRGLNHLPMWDEDKAFIWITFSDELAMQSRDKFEQYFGNVLENDLLTVDDLDQGFLKRNDILFLNWQKVVSKAAKNRLIRRPDDPLLRKEEGVYFEDFIDGTRKQSREIVLVIDEAHTNVTPDLAQDIIDYISPKLVVHVSATPKAEMVAESAELGSFILVERDRVVEAGLIKSKIVTQTAEDLKKVKSKDLDHVLLELGMAKRRELAKLYKKMGKDINPLLLVQLPNDDSQSLKAGERSKEQVVLEYLEKIGYDMSLVARWFDKHPKPAFLEQNDSPYEILLFKLAAGTGWDCPRAQVLVMYRNIRVEQRYIQTVGRILRMPEPEKADEYFQYPLLCSGFLYTNYNRNDIVDNWFDGGSSQPFTQSSSRKVGIKNVKIPTHRLSRIDYGDLSNSAKFQVSFVGSLNEFFSVSTADDLETAISKLATKGIDLKPKVTNKIMVDAEIVDFDHLNLELTSHSQDIEMEVSRNDIERIFNFFCWKLLGEQTEEEARISNVARSWSPLKTALRVWLKGILGTDSDYFYRVFIGDVNKGASSVFRGAVTFGLKRYRPILRELIKQRVEIIDAANPSFFEIQDQYSFPTGYSRLEVSLSALEDFLFPTENYSGRENELNFIKYIDDKVTHVDWWFKQGVGQEFFAVKYSNTASGKESLFYPDWIIRFKNGRVGVFDTKSGLTAIDTQGRAEALAARLGEFGRNFVGGIVVSENGVWHYNSNRSYSYQVGRLNADWKPLEGLFT